MLKIQILQRLTVLILISLAPSSFVACHPEPVVPQDATVYIIDPSAESVTTENSIAIKTFVDRFILVDAVGQANTAGEGHLVYYLDVTPPLEPGSSALTAVGTYAVSTETTHIWGNLQPGKHTFWVQLVNNDNTPLEAQAAVRVYVTVK
jgi:hypothetical protein